MRFNRPCWFTPLPRAVLYLCIGLICASCTVEVTEDEVFDDARQQVEQNILPEIVDESQAVLRTLLNFLAALPEICATPLAAMGSFASSLPGLGRPVAVELNDETGEWELIWRNAVLGDDDGILTVDTDTPRVDIILSFFFRTQGNAAVLAVPFALAPQTALRLDGEPPSYAAEDTEGFFLSQDATSGQWRLRWRALNTPKVFEGSIIALSGVFGVIRRIEGGEPNTVTSLEVNSSANTITFEETTAVGEEKGLTFFVRPGERVQFQLRLGPVGGALQPITRAQLLLGPEDQLLPVSKEPEDFILGSLLPSDPTGTPVFTPGTARGVFMWQDVETNECNAGEDQWRIRFSRQVGATHFTGTLTSIDDDMDALINRARTVGNCPAGDLSNQRDFSYDCSLSNNTPSGYDLCVTAGGRLNVTSRVDDILDPRRVFIGGGAVPPPSPFPFSILFDIEIAERQSARDLRFSEAIVTLQGNTDENENQDELVILNANQVSLDPLCRISEGSIQPRVRFNGEGEYATARFEGSAYELEQVHFTDTNMDSLADSRRFPDGGEVRLITRVSEEIENSLITTFPRNIQPMNGQVSVPMDVELTINEVEFDFPDQEVSLTVE